MSAELLQWAILTLIAVQFVTVQLGFRLLKHHIKEAIKAETLAKEEKARYERLAELRDLTKVESVLNGISLKMEQQQQEMMSAFNMFRSLLDKAAQNQRVSEWKKEDNNVEMF